MNTPTTTKWDSWKNELLRTAETQEHEWIDEDEMPHLLAEASLKGISVQTMLACRDLFHKEEHFHYAVRRVAHHGKARILLVDPDDHHRKNCEKILRGTGLYEVASTGDVSEALQKAKTFAPQILITEMALDGPANGLGLKHHMESLMQTSLPTLVLEMVLDETMFDAVAARGLLHLRKPVDSRALLHCTESLLATVS